MKILRRAPWSVFRRGVIIDNVGIIQINMQLFEAIGRTP
jgi:hypothetical protein